MPVTEIQPKQASIERVFRVSTMSSRCQLHFPSQCAILNIKLHLRLVSRWPFWMLDSALKTPRGRKRDHCVWAFSLRSEERYSERPLEGFIYLMTLSCIGSHAHSWSHCWQGKDVTIDQPIFRAETPTAQGKMDESLSKNQNCARGWKRGNRCSADS